ncbi:MAG: aldo/keto reductase [Desulfobacterales bacterium]
MASKDKGCSRRNFLKTAGATGIGAVLSQHLLQKNASAESEAKSSKNKTVPTRPFGRTGKNVSMLSLGGMFDIPANQIILKLALQFGVTYWDTAYVYGNGVSEKGIGKYFKKTPQDRDKIFLVSKAKARDPEGMTSQLETSLNRMNTDYIDLYYLHAVSNMKEVGSDVRKWAENAKKKGKIRLFGFSTHQNMEDCLMESAKLDWIDGIMVAYNFRLMHQNPMKEAIQACAEAGIGLTAMKTQGGGSVKTDSEAELRMAGRFVRKGYTDKQAKLKAVWENKNIASICSQMPDSTILMANISAALDDTGLSAQDMSFLKQYALQTCSGYCKGCSSICEAEINSRVPIGDIMRYLMYQQNYGERDFARLMQDKIPGGIKRAMASTDFSAAERKCPQKMEIGKLMRKASRILT